MSATETIVSWESKGLSIEKTTFTKRNIVNLFIVCEVDTWSKDLNADFILKDYLFGAVKSTKNANPDKYPYSGYGI